MHQLVHPEMCCVFDETGGNTRTKGDGHVGGRKLLGRCGTAVKI